MTVVSSGISSMKHLRSVSAMWKYSPEQFTINDRSSTQKMWNLSILYLLICRISAGKLFLTSSRPITKFWVDVDEDSAAAAIFRTKNQNNQFTRKLEQKKVEFTHNLAINFNFIPFSCFHPFSMLRFLWAKKSTNMELTILIAIATSLLVIIITMLYFKSKGGPQKGNFLFISIFFLLKLFFYSWTWASAAWSSGTSTRRSPSSCSNRP